MQQALKRAPQPQTSERDTHWDAQPKITKTIDTVAKNSNSKNMTKKVIAAFEKSENKVLHRLFKWWGTQSSEEI